MSQSRKAIAFAWVPNISGRVTSEETLKLKVDGHKLKTETSDREYTFNCEGHRVCVYAGYTAVMEIEAKDDSGLCVLYDNIMESDDGHYNIESTYEAVWTTFRELVDSSSEIYRCTSMDRPIKITNVCNRPEYNCMCNAIATRFINALESITDVNIYVDVSPHERAKMELDLDSVIRTNILYLERFVDLYASSLKEGLEDYKSQIRSRKDKVMMLRAYHSEKHRIENAGNIESLIVASNDLSENTEKLVSKITSYTEASNRTGKWMAALTVISITIAAISLVYAIFGTS